MDFVEMKNLKDFDDVFGGRRGDADAQASALQRGDDFRRRIGAQNQSAGAHVFLHRPSERVLRVFRQFVHLRQYHN